MKTMEQVRDDRIRAGLDAMVERCDIVQARAGVAATVGVTVARAAIRTVARCMADLDQWRVGGGAHRGEVQA